ncbi:hypothetical protein L6303_03960 [archaeon]|nr:hypothetical protein [Nanoarchaeota archaeon]MCG2723875.1 hypothetical protein [archaeon]
MKLLIVRPETGGFEALACGTKVVIPPYLSGFPYAKMCTIADEKQLGAKIFGAKPVAGKEVAHFQTKFEKLEYHGNCGFQAFSAKLKNPKDIHDFDWDKIAQQMEAIYQEVGR